MKNNHNLKSHLRHLFMCSALLCAAMPSSLMAHDVEKKKEPQGYSVTITVEYENIDLQKLAEKEKKIKEIFGDSKDIKIDFKSVCPTCDQRRIYFNDLSNGMTITPNLN